MSRSKPDSPAPSAPRVALRILLLIAAVFGLLAGLHLYIGARVLGGLGLGGVGAAAGWTAIALLFLSIPAGLFARGLRSQRLAWRLRWAAYLWMGGFALTLSAVVAVDLARLGARLAFGGPAGWGLPEVAVAAGLVLPAFLLGLHRAAAPARIERVRVPIPGLGPALEGLRLVQLSDLHIGESLDRRFAQRVVDQVNALEPDLVAITGDLVDGSVARLREEVAPLAGLRARLGVFYVTGNHECYVGAPAWERELARLGFTVLHNQHRVIERGGDRLVIAGVTDHDADGLGPEHASDPAAAFSGAPAGVPRVLLAHQPRTAFAAAPHGVALQLSGHTHGGQIFPWMFFVRLQQPVLRGLRTVAGVPVYTHRGTGYWGPPLRVGAPPEIACIRLVVDG
jgi:predicted MPP superfamily phosphohydrolase